MAESSTAETVSKFGVGLGVGFALYLLIRNLGFGGGRSFGGEGGEARGEGAPALPSTPAPSPPPTPPMPRDEQRLEFVMVRPTTLDDKTTVFRGPDNQIYALEEMIARIKAGGRADMTLKVRGDVIAGPADVAEAQIKKAGIDIWNSASEKPPAPVKTVSGNARGQYGGRGCYRGYRR